MEEVKYTSVETTEMISLVIHQHIDSKHENSLWYGGSIATATKGNLRLYVDACGDVDVELLDEKENCIAASRDKSNSGAFYSNMKPYIHDDSELVRLISEGRLVLNNNNWYEWSVYDTDSEKYIGPDALDNIFDEDTFKDMLSLDNLDTIFEYAKQYEQERM